MPPSLSAYEDGAARRIFFTHGKGDAKHDDFSSNNGGNSNNPFPNAGKDNSDDNDANKGDSNKGDNRTNSGGNTQGSFPNAFFPPVQNCNQPKACIQDFDPRLVYQGNWTLNTGDNTTTHSTTESGASVSLVFSGSGALVFGTVPQSNDSSPPPTAMYTLDGTQMTIMESQVVQDSVNQALFASSQLDGSTSHTLMINTTVTGAPYILDYIYVLPRVNVVSYNIAGNSTSDDQSPSVPPGTSSNSNTSAQASAMLQTVKILGSVMGVMIVLLLVVVGWLIIQLRRRRRRSGTTAVAGRLSVNSCLSKGTRPDGTTIFTSTESILRNNPSIMWSDYTSTNENIPCLPSGCAPWITNRHSSTPSNRSFVPLPSPLPPLKVQSSEITQ